MTDHSVDDQMHKRQTVESFDGAAARYLHSDVHREGDDLQQVADWTTGAGRVLDIATGAGHTARAVRGVGAEVVVAVDASVSMVHTARNSVDGLIGVVADAERLPFSDATFDAVTCRIAAHHFPDPKAFVSEVSRVTVPQGIFAFEDNVAPDDELLAAFLNRVERLRDPNHVRSHRESLWRSWLVNNGFEIEESYVMAKSLDYSAWLSQLDTPTANRRALEHLFRDPPEGASTLFAIEIDDNGVQSFSNLKLLLKARRTD